MSIWEVRNHKQHFTYSQIMLWVAFDRGLRLADKRNLPCPNRVKWLEARDMLYETVMEKGNSLAFFSFLLLSRLLTLPPSLPPVYRLQHRDEVLCPEL